MNIYLEQAEKWLNELGIRTENRNSVIAVNRDDMAQLGDGFPETTYDNILKELRKAMNNSKLFWGGKDDDWLFLESF